MSTSSIAAADLLGARRGAASQLLYLLVGLLLPVYADGEQGWSVVWGDTIHYGFTVFIVGGIIKAVLAGFATPLAWRAVGKLDRKA